MSDKDNRRKCVKCGKSPLMNNIKLFRFPNPAIRNLYKCTMWAKLIFPSEDQYACINFQRKLHNEHRMLCQDHFADEDFTDVSKKKLVRDAVPLEDFSPFKNRTDDQASAGQVDLDKIDDNSADNITDAHNNIDQEEFKDHIEETIELLDDGEKFDNDVQVIGEKLLEKDTPAHTDFKCNVCYGDIVGFRYTCLQCADWDMCTACEAKGEHSMHYMLRIPALTKYVDSEPVILAVREQIQNLLELSKEIKSEIYLKEEADTEERTDDFIQELMDPLVTSDRSVPEYVHQDSLTQDDVVLTNNRLTETMYTDCDMNTTDSSDTLTDLSGLLTKTYRNKSNRQKTEAVNPELTDAILVTNDRSVPEDQYQDSSTHDATITNNSPFKVTDTDCDMYTSGSSVNVKNVARLLNKASIVKPKKDVIIRYRQNPNNISQSAIRISLQEMSKAHNTKYVVVKKLKKNS